MTYRTTVSGYCEFHYLIIWYRYTLRYQWSWSFGQLYRLRSRPYLAGGTHGSICQRFVPISLSHFSLGLIPPSTLSASAAQVDRRQSRLRVVHCKKRLTVLPSPAGMSLTKLSLDGNNYIFPGKKNIGKEGV